MAIKRPDTIIQNECNDNCVECGKDDLYDIAASLLVEAAECLQINCMSVPEAAYVDVCDIAPICCEHLIVAFSGIQEYKQEVSGRGSNPMDLCHSSLYGNYKISYGMCIEPSLGREGKLPADDSLHISQESMGLLSGGWCLFNCLRTRFPINKEFLIYGDGRNLSCSPYSWGGMECYREDDCLTWVISLMLQVNGCPLLAECSEDCAECPEKIEIDCSPSHPCDDPDCGCKMIEELRDGS